MKESEVSSITELLVVVRVHKHDLHLLIHHECIQEALQVLDVGGSEHVVAVLSVHLHDCDVLLENRIVVKLNAKLIPD